MSLFGVAESMSDYRCDYCKQVKHCMLTRSLIKLPEIFIFQLQRFSSYPKLHKIRGHISFPETLNLSTFIDNSYATNGGSDASLIYELISVGVHLGTIHGGHYIAYCKKEDDQWYLMDDERVGKVSVREVL